MYVICNVQKLSFGGRRHLYQSLETRETAHVYTHNIRSSNDTKCAKTPEKSASLQGRRDQLHSKQKDQCDTKLGEHIKE